MDPANPALKQANAGYLTRGLVDVAQDGIINERDCGTGRGLTARAGVDGGEVIEPLGDRILGRTSCDDVLDPLTGDRIVAAGDIIDEAMVELVERAGIAKIGRASCRERVCQYV